MYDGDLWNSTCGLMMLYDVGMSSLFTMEAFALADLADQIGRPEGSMLRQRGEQRQEHQQSHQKLGLSSPREVFLL